MAVKKIWAVEHSCGHSVDHDLSERPADKRAGFARWLAERSCKECWLAERQSDTASREAWLAERRAAEQQAATEWAAQFSMPDLDGPPKAVPWGERCRHQLVTGAYRALVEEGDLAEADWQEIEDQVRLLDKATWWIDQRDAAPGDLPELVAAAHEARTTENPY
ncbi:hypothetical protein OU787_25855 [Kitasatospora sp. YST-16]|uniref:hypothetical protein n=1 Tax=unclassified Kitasatospora TaxID=2633591 RepID=UPI0004C31099|nr:MULTISPECIES: hypothetical protein [unclassified Kitasatospora]WAL74618.1 hypothetical protein OU787_25855 [Kitasatospora sp. YST-16]WNW40676.1 hypothetical protein RKE32_25790 [Streptomyces sp. Li-HN-5-13]